jgi:hypothetical protein
MCPRLLLPSSPAEKTAEQIEEERRRKAREDRFKSSTETVADGEEQNGAEKRKLDDFVEPANTTEEPVGLSFRIFPSHASLTVQISLLPQLEKKVKV